MRRQAHEIAVHLLDLARTAAHASEPLVGGHVSDPAVAADGTDKVVEVIYPRQLRKRLGTCLEMLRAKRESNPPKKHGNIPL